MTEEVAILNRSAVALAADSAITAPLQTGKKIFSGNKLFALSFHCPVGIMTFNNAFLMELPWETVIKMYRSTVPQRERFVTSFIYSAFISVRSEIDNEVSAQIKLYGKVDDKAIELIVKNAVNHQ